MPIPVKTIREALRPLEERIYEVLASDPENAYGPEEIYFAVSGRTSSEATAGMSESQRNENFDEWSHAINRLVTSGRIERIKLEDHYYFFVKAGA